MPYYAGAGLQCSPLRLKVPTRSSPRPCHTASWWHLTQAHLKPHTAHRCTPGPELLLLLLLLLVLLVLVVLVVLLSPAYGSLPAVLVILVLPCSAASCPEDVPRVGDSAVAHLPPPAPHPACPLLQQQLMCLTAQHRLHLAMLLSGTASCSGSKQQCSACSRPAPTPALRHASYGPAAAAPLHQACCASCS
jgi:hypothetical protein